jgi:hypothetical protein
MDGALLLTNWFVETVVSCVVRCQLKVCVKVEEMSKSVDRPLGLRKYLQDNLSNDSNGGSKKIRCNLLSGRRCRGLGVVVLLGGQQWKRESGG